MAWHSGEGKAMHSTACAALAMCLANTGLEQPHSHIFLPFLGVEGRSSGPPYKRLFAHGCSALYFAWAASSLQDTHYGWHLGSFIWDLVVLCV